MFEQEDNIERTPHMRVDIVGLNSTKWAKFKEKFMDQIFSILDTTINPNQNSTVQEEIKRATENIFSYANSKLEKATIENHKLNAEIDLLLTQSAKERAAARKINAEAEALEIENISKKIKMILCMAQVFALSNKDEEILFFCKNMELMVAKFESSNLLEDRE